MLWKHYFEVILWGGLCYFLNFVALRLIATKTYTAVLKKALILAT